MTVTRTGGPSASSSSRESRTGTQYRRKSAPIGVLLDLAVDGGGAGSASLGAGGGLSTEFSIRAVPEPSTLLAGLLGLSLAAGCSWRRPARPSRNL